MLLPYSLAARDRQPEWMDRPGLDDATHALALCGLERLNALSRTAASLWPELSRQARLARDEGRTLKVLDVATGGGDVPIKLARWAARRKLPVEFHACDLSPTALGYAESRAKQAGVRVRFRRHDVLTDPPAEEFDVTLCTLFLHHLADDDALRLLRTLKALSRRAVLLNDLARGPVGYGLVWLATRAVSRSPIVRNDGPLSVRAAFTAAEMRRLAAEAGLGGAVVTGQPPCRFLLTWGRP